MKRNMQQKHLNEHLQRHNSPSLPKYTISEYMKQKQLPILLPPPMSHRRCSPSESISIIPDQGLPSTFGPRVSERVQINDFFMSFS